MADEVSETSAAASPVGNWWSSGGPNGISEWSNNMNMNMLTQPCSTATALAEIQQWPSDIPNSSGGGPDVANLSNSDNLTHFGGDSAVWTQVLLGGGEGAGNLQEVLYCRALEKKIQEPEGPSSWGEFRPGFASFQADDHMGMGKPAPILYNHPHRLLDDRIHGGNGAPLADLGGWSVAPPDQASAGLMARGICLNTFSNSELDLPVPQFDLGRIKQEYTGALGVVSPNALLQGFGQEGFSHILESAGKPFLKPSCCSHINAGDHHNPHGGRWPMSTSSQLPVALSQLLPSSSASKQSPPGVLTFGSGKQHFDGKQIHSAPAQHRIAGDEARAESCADTKRCGADQSAAGESMFKRPRLEGASAIPPFKVRKEKLGDRITALQQLVSPFGKTDTASVLLEAIGYIKFLQEQVQVLSTPYMKSGGTPAQGAQDQKGRASSEKKDPDEPKQDLRSRGLCLVPVSCTLHVANDNGADYWTPSLGTGSYR